MNYKSQELFICFSAEDRYSVVEPIVYHLKNYGIHTWYDRERLLLGDNRHEKNLIEGAGKCEYAAVVISHSTNNSKCAMEEISIIKDRHINQGLTVFPIIYEISPEDLPKELQWIKQLIYKEIDKKSGTRELCNHIVCKITDELLKGCSVKKIQEIQLTTLHPLLQIFISKYQEIDYANLNSRVTLLYSTYLLITSFKKVPSNPITDIAIHVCERVFSEMKLDLHVDYREIWLLENAICLLVNQLIGLH